MKALVSIHDLMPETMDRVEAQLDWLRQIGVPPVSLLVVPGKDWTPRQIDRLRELREIGHPLAAHGWHHQTTPRRLYHRLHASLISRNAAEHLALDSQGVLDLLRRASTWFEQNQLPLPDTYVPPAWALGPISHEDLTQAPYRWIETTRGYLRISPLPSIKDPAAAMEPNRPTRVTFQKLPLTGYEADTPLREVFLRRWNVAQARRAQRSDRPLRISIHPNDLQLRLADQLASQLHTVSEFQDINSLL